MPLAETGINIRCGEDLRIHREVVWKIMLEHFSNTLIEKISNEKRKKYLFCKNKTKKTGKILQYVLQLFP